MSCFSFRCNLKQNTKQFERTLRNKAKKQQSPFPFARRSLEQRFSASKMGVFQSVVTASMRVPSVNPSRASLLILITRHWKLTEYFDRTSSTNRLMNSARDRSGDKIPPEASFTQKCHHWYQVDESSYPRLSCDQYHWSPPLPASGTRPVPYCPYNGTDTASPAA